MGYHTSMQGHCDETCEKLKRTADNSWQSSDKVRWFQHVFVHMRTNLIRETKMMKMALRIKTIFTFSYLRQWAPGQQRLPWGHACQHRSRWKRCWRSHHHHQWSCQRASDRQAGSHAPDNRAPSRHCQFGLQLGQHEWRYIHAGNDKNCKICNGFYQAL